MRLEKDEVVTWRSNDGVEITSSREHDSIDDSNVLLHLCFDTKISTITMPKGFGIFSTGFVTP
jgi:hypothetical protein